MFLLNSEEFVGSSWRKGRELGEKHQSGCIRACAFECEGAFVSSLQIVLFLIIHGSPLREDWRSSPVWHQV